MFNFRIDKDVRKMYDNNTTASLIPHTIPSAIKMFHYYSTLANTNEQTLIYY